MAGLGTLSLKLTAQTEEFIRGLNGAEGKVQSTATKLVEAGKAIAGAWILKEVIQNTIEAEDAIAQLEAAIKSTGGAAGFTSEQLQGQAAALQKVSTFSDEAIEGAQAILLTFTQIRGQNFTAATEAVVNLATRMGTDLKGAAVQVGKALNDPVNGLSSLSKAGIQFTDTQKETIKRLVETGDKAKAQTIILKELETQFGGSAAAARDTLGGALTGLKNAFGDALEAGTGMSGALAGAFNLTAEAIGITRRALDSIMTSFQLGTVEITAFFGKLFGDDAKWEAWRKNRVDYVLGLKTITAESVKAAAAAEAAAKAEEDAAKKAGIAATELAELKKKSAAAAKQHQEALSKEADNLMEEIVLLRDGKKALDDYKLAKLLSGQTPGIVTPAQLTALSTEAAELRALDEIAKRHGVTIEYVKRAMTEFIPLLPMAGDGLERLRRETDDLVVSNERLSSGVQRGSVIFSESMNEMQDSLGQTASALNQLLGTGAFNGFIGGGGITGMLTNFFGSIVDQVITGAADFRASVQAWRDSWQEFQQSLDEWLFESFQHTAMEELQHQLEGWLKKAFAEFGSQIFANDVFGNEAWSDLVKSLTGGFDDIQRLQDALASGQFSGKLKEAIENYLAALLKIQEGFEERSRQITESAGDTVKSLALLGDGIQAFADGVKQTAKDMVDAVVDLSNGIPSFGGRKPGGPRKLGDAGLGIDPIVIDDTLGGGGSGGGSAGGGAFGGGGGGGSSAAATASRIAAGTMEGENRLIALEATQVSLLRQLVRLTAAMASKGLLFGDDVVDGGNSSSYLSGNAFAT